MVLGRSAFASVPPVVRLALLAVVPRHAHPLRWARDHFSIVGVNCLCPELMRWAQDKPRRCRQARTLCCCQSTPACTTDPECASAVRQLLQQCSAPLLVLGRSLGDHWPPDLPNNGFAIGGTCTWMSQRSYDVSACPLAVRSVTAHTSKPVSLLRSACGSLTFHHHDPVVTTGYRAHDHSSQTLFTLPLPLPLLLPLAFPSPDAMPSCFPSDEPCRF